jgi:transcription elongation factor Elf1
MGQPMTCADCNNQIKVTIEPYGKGNMAVFTCKDCGISYDTNID